MALNQISEQAKAHLKVVPQYLKIRSSGGHRAIAFYKIAETLKLIDREQGLCYAKEEFDREFGKIQYARVSLRAILSKMSPDLKPRIIVDDTNVWVFANRKVG